MLDLSKITGFEWDQGNLTKNLDKHQVTWPECEQAFANRPRVISYDKIHSKSEQRYFILGMTHAQRKLAIVFTIRGDKIRVISARDQKRGQEREQFTQAGD